MESHALYAGAFSPSRLSFWYCFCYFNPPVRGQTRLACDHIQRKRKETDEKTQTLSYTMFHAPRQEIEKQTPLNNRKQRILCQFSIYMCRKHLRGKKGRKQRRPYPCRSRIYITEIDFDRPRQWCACVVGNKWMLRDWCETCTGKRKGNEPNNLCSSQPWLSLSKTQQCSQH